MTKVLIDENLSQHFAEGLDKLQYPLGNNVIVTSISIEFGRGVADEDWIPAWDKQKGIFITQDIRIHTTRHQAQLLIDHKLGAFFLDVPKNFLYWDRMKLIIHRWPEIVELIKTTKLPFAYKITPRKLERLNLT